MHLLQKILRFLGTPLCQKMEAMSSGDDEPECHWSMEMSKKSTPMEQAMQAAALAVPVKVASTASSTSYFMPLQTSQHDGDFESDVEDVFEQPFKTNKKDIKNEKLAQRAVEAHMASQRSALGEEPAKMSKRKAKAMHDGVPDHAKDDVPSVKNEQPKSVADLATMDVKPEQNEQPTANIDPVNAADKLGKPDPAEQPTATAEKPVEVDETKASSDKEKKIHEKKIDMVAARTEWVDMWKKSNMSLGLDAKELHKRACEAWRTSSEREYLASLYSEPERKRRRL